MVWDYGVGVYRMDAPRVQGVAGFLKAGGGQFKMRDVQVESGNAYAAISVVSLDDRPLSESKKVLVQIGTTARLTGWETLDAEFEFEKMRIKGEQIVNTGKPPWRVADAEVTVTISNAGLSKAMKLDAGGYAAGEVAVRRDGKTMTVKLPRDTMDLVLE